MAMMGFEPDKAIDVMLLINARQLNAMADRLLPLFPKASPQAKKLTKALEFLQQLKVDDASALMAEIMFGLKASADHQAVFDKIVTEAKQFGEDTMNSLRSGDIPEFLLQVPSISK